MNITLTPIAVVKNSRKKPIDDNWGSILSEIELAPEMHEEAISNISQFSHLEIIYYFNQVMAADVVYASHPRGNKAYPFTGIFSQRKKDRPNQLGLCTVKLLEQKGRTLLVQGLDAIDNTPVLDIKPVFRQFEPVGEIIQPEWVDSLMAEYWK